MSINIYVGNMPYSFSESDIRDLFLPFGEVTRVKVVMDRYTGKSKGFAFVEMTDKAAGEEAIERLNDREVLGRTLKVSVARPRNGRTDTFRTPSGSGPFRRGPGGKDPNRF